MSNLKDTIWPAYITTAKGLIVLTDACPYAGEIIENTCEKYKRWAIINAALFPTDHDDYQQGLKTFINNLITYYNDTHDPVHQFEQRDYYTALELL
jgi:hypothetical protein